MPRVRCRNPPASTSSAAPGGAAHTLESFNGLARHHLIDANGDTVQTFQPQLSPLQHEVLDLLGIPSQACTTP